MFKFNYLADPVALPKAEKIDLFRIEYWFTRIEDFIDYFSSNPKEGIVEELWYSHILSIPFYEAFYTLALTVGDKNSHKKNVIKTVLEVSGQYETSERPFKKNSWQEDLMNVSFDLVLEMRGELLHKMLYLYKKEEERQAKFEEKITELKIKKLDEQERQDKERL